MNIQAESFIRAFPLPDSVAQKEYLCHALNHIATSRSQVDSLTRLLNRRKLARAFYDLREFEGLWSGFQHGNLGDLVALRCDEVRSVCATKGLPLIS